MFLLVVPVALTKFVKINHKYWQQCEQNSWRQTQHFLLISQHPPAPPLFSEHKSSKSWLLDEDEECEMKYFHFRYWHISKDYYFGSTNCASVTATFFAQSLLKYFLIFPQNCKYFIWSHHHQPATWCRHFTITFLSYYWLLPTSNNNTPGTISSSQLRD